MTVSTFAPTLASICLPGSAYCPVGASSRYLLNASGFLRAQPFCWLRGGLANQVYALPVVGVGAGWIGRNDFVEGSDCQVDLSSICKNGAHVEFVLSDVGWIEWSSLIAGDCVVGDASLQLGVGKVVVVGSDILALRAGRLGLRHVDGLLVLLSPAAILAWQLLLSGLLAASSR